MPTSQYYYTTEGDAQVFYRYEYETYRRNFVYNDTSLRFMNAYLRAGTKYNDFWGNWKESDFLWEATLRVHDKVDGSWRAIPLNPADQRNSEGEYAETTTAIYKIEGEMGNILVNLNPTRYKFECQLVAYVKELDDRRIEAANTPFEVTAPER